MATVIRKAWLAGSMVCLLKLQNSRHPFSGKQSWEMPAHLRLHASKVLFVIQQQVSREELYDMWCVWPLAPRRTQQVSSVHEESTECVAGTHALLARVFPNPFVADDGYSRVSGQGGGFRGTILAQERYGLPKMESFCSNNVAASTWLCPGGLCYGRTCAVEIALCHVMAGVFLSEWALPFICRTEQHRAQPWIPSRPCGSEPSLKHTWI